MHLADSPIGKRSNDSQPTPDARTDLRVLLVEDHADTANVMAKLLARNGKQVKIAHDVKTALHLAASEQFDVVVSDVGLPDGTGYELMKQLRERYALKGIAMSGYGLDEDLEQSREAGFDEHLLKPVTIAKLEEAIHRVKAKNS